jgi:hypothetical protein
MNRIKAMQNLVNQVLGCQCAELLDCGRIAASVMAARTK